MHADVQSTEEAVLSDEQMMTIAERIACYDWQRVGISLDIPYTQLESLRKEHSTNPSAAVMAMLTKWLERGRKQKLPGAEMKRDLKSALEKMKFGRLAMEIFPDICTPLQRHHSGKYSVKNTLFSVCSTPNKVALSPHP